MPFTKFRLWESIQTLGIASLTVLCFACAGSGGRLASVVEQLGLEEPETVMTPLPASLVRGSGDKGKVLHVYIEGDGTPWIHQRKVASDPSPRRYLMLELMAMDSSPAVYLGRPCYHGHSDHGACRSWHWTMGRYSEEVVVSLSATLAEQMRRDGLDQIVLIGHSGGGTLAMLLAERLPGVQSVITLAGNLDPDSWCDLHNYSALSDSLNPSLRAPLDSSVRQLHLVGEDDIVIPPELVEKAANLQPGARVEILKGCDHSSCWETVWPTILAEELGDNS